MTSASPLLRSLIVYSICLPLAILVGYLLGSFDWRYSQNYALPVLILAFLSIPLFLRWHYPWLLLTWNMSAILFFAPGRPQLGQLMIIISFFVSVLQYVLNRRMKFIRVPMVSRPLLFILLVVLLTARLTGGIGLNAFGASSNAGGRRYIALILAVVGYFALTAVKIPPQKRKLYVLLYFGGTLTCAFANLAYVISPVFSFIFLIFPTDQEGINALFDNSVTGPIDQANTITRLSGLSVAGLAFLSLALAFYGLRGFLDTRKPWRLLILLLLLVGVMLGGYRSQIIIIALTLGLLFYLEGLARTRLLPLLLFTLVLGAALLVPFANRLPLNVQRSLAFLPIDLDPVAVRNAQGSTDWRVEMWQQVLPTVPNYLIVGKGLGVDLQAVDMANSKMNRSEGTDNGAMLAGDYHNGPLSTIIPFGLFGVAGFIWFLVAGTKVLYRNYKYGDPDLVIVNRLFFAQFIVKIIIYFLIFGSFYSDLIIFSGIVGFSIALNHGVACPAVQPLALQPLEKQKRATAVRALRA